MGKKTDYDSLKQGFGLVHGLSTEFVRICERHSVPIEALHRLVTPEGESTMEAIIGRINADWQRAQAKENPEKKSRDKANAEGRLLADEFLVHLDRGMPRGASDSEVELSKEATELHCFGFDWYSQSQCYDEPGERIMLIKRFDQETQSEANIALMDKLGYRPATHHEAYAFAKANPKPRGQFSIVALGSYMDIMGPSIAVLRVGPNGYILGIGDPDILWPSGTRFLFVRK